MRLSHCKCKRLPDQRLGEDAAPEVITYHAVDELQVAGALAVTVPSTILRSCFVGGVLARSTILIHRNKVECAIKALRDKC
jgi:hypothetical protein